jgi:lipid-binding SYLF domain-containing protein
MTRKSIILKTIISGAVLVFGVLAQGATTAQIDQHSSAALNLLFAENANNRELVRKAAAVLVFPGVTKAGAGIAGSFGEGELRVHGSTVGYYKVTGASVGATLGVAKRSEVILFMTEEARQKFLDSSGWTIGADTGVAIVRGAGSDLDSETLQRPVLAMVFDEKGLIADVSLEGTKVTKLNE